MDLVVLRSAVMVDPTNDASCVSVTRLVRSISVNGRIPFDTGMISPGPGRAHHGEQPTITVQEFWYVVYADTTIEL